MELKNCVKCGRAFAYVDSDLCSRCGGGDEDDFKKVKLYLYDHPGANVVEVSEETGVSEKQILRYLRENRIEIIEEDNLLLDCERCGVSIRSGRFCDKCTAELQRELTQAIQPKVEEEKRPQRTAASNKLYVAEMRKNIKKSK